MTRLQNSDQRGAVILESALALPIFFFALIATFELLRVSYHSLSLQYTATSVMRDSTLATPSSVRSAVTSTLKGFGISLNAADTVTFCPVDHYKTAACPANTEQQMAGNERDLMVLVVHKQVSGFLIPWLSNLSIDLHASVLGRNEPWD